MKTVEQIQKIIEQALPESHVKVIDPMNDGVHLSAEIQSPAFNDKSRVEQHRMVNNALKEYFDDGSLHALQFKTIKMEK